MILCAQLPESIFIIENITVLEEIIEHEKYIYTS